MDPCLLKHSELAPHVPQYKRGVVVRGDNVKDGFGWKAVFTDQADSGSQITAAKFPDTIDRLIEMAGATNDAISGDTQVKLKDAHRFSSFRQRTASQYGRLPRDRRPANWDKINDPAVPPESIYMSITQSIVGTQNEERLLNETWEK